MLNTQTVQLGCGLIRLGRKWGFKESNVPSLEESQKFLHTAAKLGIHFFDTAPSYGVSEERLGKFLSSMPAEARKKLTIATKLGEHWDKKNQKAYVDFSYSALKKSIVNSLVLLGNIDIIQIHKTTPDILDSRDMWKALDYAKSCGVKKIGASVSDSKSAQLIVKQKKISVVQLPFNKHRNELKEVIQEFIKEGKYLIINRPLNMGSILYENPASLSAPNALVEAYNYILQNKFTGVVLTGTSNPNHLRNNLQAFLTAVSNKRP